MLHKITPGQSNSAVIAAAVFTSLGLGTGAGSLLGGGDDKEIEQLRRDIDANATAADANSTALVAAEDSISDAEKAMSDAEKSMLRDSVFSQRWTMDQLIMLSKGMNTIARALDLDLDVRVDPKLPEIQ